MKKMKDVFAKALLIFAIALLPVGLLCACGKNKTPADNRQPWEITDAAKENLARNINASNYVVVSTDGTSNFLKTSVCSEDLVLFDYYDDETYGDFAVMTVNERETFQAFLSQDGFKANTLTFLKDESALNLAKAEYKVLNALNPAGEISKADLDRMFQTYVKEPLKMTSRDETVIEIISNFSNIKGFAKANIQEVSLIFSKEDASKVVMKTTIDETTYSSTITFGNATSEARVDNWVNDPNREYPEAQTEWAINAIGQHVDRNIINDIFLRRGNEAETDYLPFPDFATYAFTMNRGDYYLTDTLQIRDCRATEQNAQDYVSELLAEGFTAAVDEDGDTCYRKFLRAHRGTNCYASIYVEYDEGFNLYGEKWYDAPSYNTLADINTQLTTKAHLTALPNSDDFGGVNAKDITFEHSESVLGISDYDLVLYIDIECPNYVAAMEYMDAYITLCGFPEVHEDVDGAFISSYTNGETEKTSIKYGYLDSVLTIIVKYKTFYTDAEAGAIIEEYGFPAITAYLQANNSTCEDVTMHERIQYYLCHNQVVAAYITFESAEACEAFLEDYIGQMHLGEVGTKWERLTVNQARVPESHTPFYNEEEALLFTYRIMDNAGTMIELNFKKVSDQSKPNI